MSDGGDDERYAHAQVSVSVSRQHVYACGHVSTWGLLDSPHGHVCDEDHHASAHANV
jgi:hypothetical protein